MPVNYGYSYDENYTFYFHGAKAGRKYELAKNKPNMNQTTSKNDWHYSNEMLEAVAVFRLDVDKLSCKAK